MIHDCELIMTIIWGFVNLLIFVSATEQIVWDQDSLILSHPDAISWVLTLFFLAGPVVWVTYPIYSVFVRFVS